MTQPRRDTGGAALAPAFPSPSALEAGAGHRATLTHDPQAALLLTGIDLAGLHRLLACAGAEHAAELRLRFLGDLAGAEAGLRGAQTPREAEAHAHVLLGLSGQAGAVRLHAQAGELMAAARVGDAGAMRDRLPGVLAGIAALSQIIAGLRLALHPDPAP